MAGGYQERGEMPDVKLEVWRQKWSIIGLEWVGQAITWWGKTSVRNLKGLYAL